MEEVEVKVNEAEAKALIDLMQDAKVPAEMGYILTQLKYKILQEFQKKKATKDQEEAIKKLNVEEEE